MSNDILSFNLIFKTYSFTKIHFLCAINNVQQKFVSNIINGNQILFNDILPSKDFLVFKQLSFAKR